MTKAQFKSDYRAARVAARKARKQANRIRGWQRWAAGMTLLKSILLEEKPKLDAMAAADWRLDRITPANFQTN